MFGSTGIHNWKLVIVIVIAIPAADDERRAQFGGARRFFGLIGEVGIDSFGLDFVESGGILG